MEVPIAVPLRVPSMDARQQSIVQEEMDIGASVASAPLPLNHDLLDLGLSPPSDIPSAGRFHMGKALNDTDSHDGASSPQSISEGVRRSEEESHPSRLYQSEDLSQSKGKSRMSYERKQSLNANAIMNGRKRGGSVSGGIFAGDDIEGDLGYAAASEMENSTRKVIVERLEAVKSNNPVFSWC